VQPNLESRLYWLLLGKAGSGAGRWRISASRHPLSNFLPTFPPSPQTQRSALLNCAYSVVVIFAGGFNILTFACRNMEPWVADPQTNQDREEAAVSSFHQQHPPTLTSSLALPTSPPSHELFPSQPQHNSTRPFSQNPFADHNQHPPADNPSPRLHSELYDSFLTGYFDLYKKEKPDLATVPDNEADMASYNQFGPPASSSNYSQVPPRPPPHQSNYPSEYGRSDHRNEPSSYPDDVQEPVQHHNQDYPSPYRDSPSPEMHPGINPPNNYDRSYNSQPYESLSRSQYNHSSSDQDAYGYAPGATAGVAAGAASAFRNNQNQTYQSYRPPENSSSYTAYPGENMAQDSRADYDQYSQDSPYNASPFLDPQSGHASYTSADNLAATAAPPAKSTPYSQGAGRGGAYGGGSSWERSNLAPPNHPYQNPYDAHSISRNNLNGMDYVDPNNLVDDGDDGLMYQQPKRRSMISLNRRSMGSNTALAAAGGAGAAAGGLAGAAALGDTSRSMYTPDLQNPPVEKSPAAFQNFAPEKDEPSRKWKKWLFLAIGIFLLGAIAAGVVVGVMQRNKSSNNSNPSTSNGVGADGPDPDINSPSVKKLLNNKNLHKVFQGMAYTPMNTQYPGCLTLPAIQANVTYDLAILGQLTNTLRTYGTDCKQNEMILHAIDQLKLTDMRLWLGVWLDSNQTTNTRQIEQLYKILDGPDVKYIKGIIVGNEVLYRKDLTQTQLEGIITDVRNNLTSRGVNLPVASADLGSNWSASFAAAVDVVMSNVHPFFGGVPVAQAAAWTWTFWQQNDVVITQGTNKQQIISEVGWPSQGGNDCAPATTCPDPTSGAVAGISQMNQFIDTFVCQTLANGTDYFW
jgi:exo-beta-1,3-glucanase (GH17 family)